MKQSEATALAQNLFVGAAMQAINCADDTVAQEWADKLERVARHMSTQEIADAEQCVEAMLRQQDEQHEPPMDTLQEMAGEDADARSLGLL